MPPRFVGAEGPGWRLYHADCLPILHALPDACLDGVITDPPYSSGGWTAASRRRDPSRKYHLGEAQPSFTGDQRDQRGYAAWCREWMGECFRALKSDRVFLCFTDWRQLPTLSDAVQAAGFVWRAVAVWDKGLAARPQPNWFRSQSELIICATKGGAPPLVSPIYLPGVFTIPAPRGEERQHLTEKPVELAAELVRLVPDGGLVCDPFAGSGSIGEAACRAGRRFLGVEVHAAYHGLASARLAGVAGGRPSTGQSSGGLAPDARA